LIEQNEREKRLNEASQRSIEQMNTAQRGKAERGRVLGKLSVVVGANRRGEIVIREGDSIKALARSFVIA
jgi:hypothetical protein